jgi:hypothetical protein
MAKAIGKTSISITIELSAEEAKWLKAVMQNPLKGESPVEEDDGNFTKRSEIFTTLKGLGVN